jgi:hypothetical protein
VFSPRRVQVRNRTPILGNYETFVIRGILGMVARQGCTQHCCNGGLAVARCSLEDVQPFRILEVPVWMFDTAACCRIRTARSCVVTVESLRELTTVLRCTESGDLDFAIQGQHRYLLNAGGADVGVAEATEIHSTGVVRPAASQGGLAGIVARDSTEDTAPGDATAAAGKIPVTGRASTKPSTGTAREVRFLRVSTDFQVLRSAANST